MTSNVAKGAAILCIVTWYSTSAGDLQPTISDTAGNSYSILSNFTSTVTGATNTIYQVAYLATNVKASAASTNSVSGTITSTSTPTAIIYVIEMPNVSALDNTSHSSGTASNAVSLSLSGTDQTGNELVLYALCWDSGTAVLNNPSGYTTTLGSSGAVGGAIGYELSSKQSVSPRTISTTFQSSATPDYVGGMFKFYTAAGAKTWNDLPTPPAAELPPQQCFDQA
jgi:hypothetical protein